MNNTMYNSVKKYVGSTVNINGDNFVAIISTTTTNITHKTYQQGPYKNNLTLTGLKNFYTVCTGYKNKKF